MSATDAAARDALLADLPSVVRLVRVAEDHLTARVRECRARGASWQAIGDALGCTRQSAWEKFARAVGDQEPTP